jgi:hypothetical protein
MASLLASLGRSGGKKDPMRESAALTTVYLLEQNQKFERFMQQKVDELESRVAAQQARLSTRAETEERELWAALEAVEDLDDVLAQAEPVDSDDPMSEAQFDIGDELSESTEALLTPEASEPSTGAKEEAVPDYLALMGGTATPSEDDNRIDTLEAVMVEATEPEAEINPVASHNEADDLPAPNETDGESPPDDPYPVSPVNAREETVPADRAVPSAEDEGLTARPGDRLTATEAKKPVEDVPAGKDNLPSPAKNFTEASEEADEVVPWVEAVSLAPPGPDEVDEIWPEMEGNEVELLAEHLAGAEAEDDEARETSLPEGKKDNWT